MNDFNSMQDPLGEDPDKKQENEEKPAKSLSGGIQPQISPIAAAFIGLIGGFILYQIVGGVITLLVFGMNLESAPVDAVRLMTMAGQLLFILLPALLFSKWFYVDVSAVIRTKIPSWKEFALFGLGIIILTPLLQYYIIVQNYFIDIWAASSPFIHSIKTALDSLNDLVEKTYGNLLAANNVFEGLFVVLVVAIIPARYHSNRFEGKL